MANTALRKSLRDALVDLTDEECLALASEFEVAVFTPKRWANGTANPHPRLAARIIRSMRLRRKPIGDTWSGEHPEWWNEWDWFVHDWGGVGQWVAIALLSGVATGEILMSDEDQAKARARFGDVDVFALVQEPDYPVARLARCANHDTEECETCGTYLVIACEGSPRWDSLIENRKR